MADLILHHYPTSPFSEKIRLILGYKKLAWRSVIIPRIMPKPDVLALTGGYRKTPFLQIGADIYCDTALICDVLEHIQPNPTLYPDHQKGAARILAQWADDKLFWPAMAHNFSPKGSAQMFGLDKPNVDLAATGQLAKAFADDRGKMRLGMPRMSVGDGTGTYKSYLRRLANMLDGQDYLLGAAPTVADFAAYHPLWFTRVQTPVMADVFNATPGVLAWMDRMAAIGNGVFTEISASEAIAISARATSEEGSFSGSKNNGIFQDEHGIPLGTRVTIAAESFGPETTEGELIAATRTTYTLRRVDERAGTVRVHFPRVGFVLKKAEA